MGKGEASGKGSGEGWGEGGGCGKGEGQGPNGPNEWKNGICGNCSPCGMCKSINITFTQILGFIEIQ